MNTRIDESRPNGGAVLKLDELQRDLVLSLVRSSAAAALPSRGRDAYAALEEAVANMEVPADLVARLSTIVEVALSTGRARNVFGPAAELSLTALLKKTPRGQTIGASFGELNRGLSKLKGRPLNEISAAFRRTGAYTLTIAAGEYRMVVRFDHDGAAVESVETSVG